MVGTYRGVYKRPLLTIWKRHSRSPEFVLILWLEHQFSRCQRVRMYSYSVLSANVNLTLTEGKTPEYFCSIFYYHVECWQQNMRASSPSSSSTFYSRLVTKVLWSTYTKSSQLPLVWPTIQTQTQLLWPIKQTNTYEHEHGRKFKGTIHMAWTQTDWCVNCLVLLVVLP